MVSGKNIFALLAVGLFVLAIAPMLASAVNLQITGLEINNRAVSASGSDSNKYERGEELDVSVQVKALAGVSDVQVEAEIYGYRYATYEEDLISDTSRPLDYTANDTEWVDLHLQVPTKIDRDYFKLRVRACDRNSVSCAEQTYQLRLSGIEPENAISIRDVVLSPDSVMSGRAFTASIKVKNIGDDDLNDLKAVVEVPELNIKDVEYLDELDADDTNTFEKILLRVPQCAKPGLYDVNIRVEFDEYEVAQQETTITVTEDPACGSGRTEGKTTIRVPQSQEAAPGATIVFPVIIENAKTTPQTYTISVSGVAFGTARVDPGSLAVVNGLDAKTAYVYITVNPNEAAGEKVFAVNVQADSESRQIPLTVKVTGEAAGASSLDNVKKAIEVGLVILLIVIIIVGLIIGFSKLKDQQSGKKSEPEPYY